MLLLPWDFVGFGTKTPSRINATGCTVLLELTVNCFSRDSMSLNNASEIKVLSVIRLP